MCSYRSSYDGKLSNQSLLWGFWSNILLYLLTGASLIKNVILFFPELWLKQMLNMHQQGRQWKKPLKGNTRFSLQVSQHHWPFLDYHYLHFCDLAVLGSSVTFIRFQYNQLTVPPRPLYRNVVHFRWPRALGEYLVETRCSFVQEHNTMTSARVQTLRVQYANY